MNGISDFSQRTGMPRPWNATGPSYALNCELLWCRQREREMGEPSNTEKAAAPEEDFWFSALKNLPEEMGTVCWPTESDGQRGDRERGTLSIEEMSVGPIPFCEEPEEYMKAAKAVLSGLLEHDNGDARVMQYHMVCVTSEARQTGKTALMGALDVLTGMGRDGKIIERHDPWKESENDPYWKRICRGGFDACAYEREKEIFEKFRKEYPGMRNVKGPTNHRAKWRGRHRVWFDTCMSAREAREEYTPYWAMLVKEGVIPHMKVLVLDLLVPPETKAKIEKWRRGQ